MKEGMKSPGASRTNGSLSGLAPYLTADQRADDEKHLNNGVLRIATATCCRTVAVEDAVKEVSGV